MVDWSLTPAGVLDGLTYPQLRLLTEMQGRRIRNERRWQLQIASLTIQSEEAMKVLQDMLDALDEEEDVSIGNQADMGADFKVSKRYPLLHELTPQMVSMDKRLSRLVRFKTYSTPDVGKDGT